MGGVEEPVSLTCEIDGMRKEKGLSTELKLTQEHGVVIGHVLPNVWQYPTLYDSYSLLNNQNEAWGPPQPSSLSDAQQTHAG